MRFGFKEWAVVCQALASGRQATRFCAKAAFAEESGALSSRSRARLWLLPTFLHQGVDGLKPEAAAWLPDIERDRPPADVIRLTHYVEVPGVFRTELLEPLLELDRLHVWSEATVRQQVRLSATRSLRAPGPCFCGE